MVSAIMIVILLAAMMIMAACAQTLSLSMTNETSQLICSLQRPNITCVHNAMRYTSMRSFQRITAAAQWSPRHHVIVRVYPHQLAYESAPSGQRHVLPEHSLVVIGANTVFRERRASNDVWASGDGGVTWNIIAGITPVGDYAYGAAAYSSFEPLFAPTPLYNASSGQMYLLAGSVAFHDGCTNSVWTSNNMIDWINTTAHAPFVARAQAVGDIDQRNGTMYLLAGRTDGGQCLSDVWTSPDGIHWQFISDGQYPARQEPQFALVYSSRLERTVLTLVGGYNSGYGDLQDVWLSIDGGFNWYEVKAHDNVKKPASMLMAVAASNVVVLTMGNNYNLYVSFDGAVSWFHCSSATPLSERGWVGATFDEYDHLLIMGGERAEAEFHDVWRSTFSYSDIATLAQFCIAVNSSGNDSASIPAQIGLQCWPPTLCVDDTITNITANQSTQFDGPTEAVSQNSLILHPPNMPLLLPSSSLPLLISASGSVLCTLRSTHSILCTDVTSDEVSLSLSSSCPWSNEATYQCGVGRLDIDGKGWIGSAYNDTTVSPETAAGFSFVSVTAVNASAVGLFLLTAEPDHHPTYYGSTAMNWDYSLNTIQYTDSYCLSPRPRIAPSQCFADIVKGVQYGADILHLQVANVSECTAACCAMEACQSFSVIVSGDMNCDPPGLCCYLKSAVTTLEPYYDPNAVSGIVQHSTSLLRSVPLIRHIAVDSVLRTPMQAVCGDSDKACGLLFNGTIVCWHSYADERAPVTVSPPSYLTFIQMSCGIRSGSSHVSYVCAILSNIGLIGHIICWSVSGRHNEMMYLDNIEYWMFSNLFENMDPLLQQRLWKTWENDTSISGMSSCLDMMPERSISGRMTQHIYETTPQSAVIRTLAQQVVFKGVSCLHWSATCSFLALNDTLYRTSHDFMQPLTLIDLKSSSHGQLVQVVSLSSPPLLTTSVSARVSSNSPAYWTLDEHTTFVSDSDWSLLIRQSLSHIFDVRSLNILCGILSRPHAGQISCTQPSAMKILPSIESVDIRRITFGVSAFTNRSNSIDGMCVQPLNETRWRCGPSPFPSPLLDSINTSAIVPISTGDMNLFHFANNHRWWPRFSSLTHVYPHPLTFRTSNGLFVVTLPSDSLIMSTSSPGGNDIWASDGSFIWYLIAGVTSTGIRAYGNAAYTSHSSLYFTTALHNKTTGQVYLVSGGSGTDYTNGLNTVWTSTNMTDWKEIHNNLTRFAPRIQAVGGVDSAGRMYLATGHRVDNHMLNDVWYSYDAIDWQVACLPCSFSPRLNAMMSIVKSAYIAADIITLIGGFGFNLDDQYSFLNDVHVSSDGGYTWLCITMAATFSARSAAILEVTTSNVLMLATGADSYGVYGDFWLSYDGGMSWYQCERANIEPRLFAASVLNAQNHLLILGGWNNLIAFNDIHRSMFPVNDTEQLANWCVGSRPFVVPQHPGLQCWSNTSTCNTTDHHVINSSSTTGEYTLLMSLLDSDTDIANFYNISIEEAMNTTNLHVWTRFISSSQANNFNLWSSRANINTIYSSTSWSSSLYYSRPTSLSARYTQIAATYDFACALMTNGTVVCWGSNSWFIMWPRCHAQTCWMYGNLCASSISCNVSAPLSQSRPYSTLNAPVEYAPYVDMCVTSGYACAVSNNSYTKGSIICWMGIYANGRELVRWKSPSDRIPQDITCTRRLDGILVCPAEMSADTNAFIDQHFISLRCSQFSVCGITINGSVLCSSLPIRNENNAEDILTTDAESPVVSLSQTADNTVCGVLLNGTVRCSDSSSQVPVEWLNRGGSFDATSIASQHEFRVGGGTHSLPCDGGSYSDRPGSITSMCSGPCLGGYIGSENVAERSALSTEKCLSMCPLGAWCPPGSTQVIYCEKGTSSGLTAVSSSSSCQPCVKLGQYCPEGSPQPSLCPKGTYCPNSTDALPCPAGSYGADLGLYEEACSGPCEPGFTCTEFSVTNKQQPCPPGQYNMKAGQTHCESCDFGTFAEQSPTGTQVCTACGPGRYTSYKGSSQCLVCPPGHFAAGSESERCTPCPAGTHSDYNINGSTSCSLCDRGEFTDTDGNQQCSQCPVDTYALLNGSRRCESCTGIAGVECDNGIAIIKPAYHGSVALTRLFPDGVALVLVTQRCPDGYCVGTDSTKFDATQVAEYNTSGISETIYISLPGQCSPNRDPSPSSPLCGQCQANYAPSDVGSPYIGCVPCDGVSWLKLGLFITVSWLFVVIYYIFANGRLSLISTCLYFIQTIAIMVSSHSSILGWLRAFATIPFSMILNTCLAPMSPEQQYALPLVIPPMQILQLVIIVAIHYLVKRFSSTRAYQLNPLTMTYMMTASQSVVYEREHALSTGRWWSTLIRYRVWPELTVSTVVRSIYLILIASFTSVMITCISWFQCTQDIAVGITRASGSVVFAFPAVSCTSPSYFGWSIVMVAHMSGWLIIIGLTTTWLIYNRRYLPLLQRRSRVAVPVPLEYELTAVTSLALVPHVATTDLTIDLSPPFIRSTRFLYWPLDDDDDDDLHNPVCGNESGDPMESRLEYAYRSVYGCIYDSFSPDAIGWNIVILTRRLIIILLSVVLTTYPAAKFMSYALVHFFLFCLHLYYKPFIVSLMNTVESVAIGIHLAMAIIMNAYPLTMDDSVNSILLTLAIAPFVAFIIFYATQHVLQTSPLTHSPSEQPSQPLRQALLLSDESDLEPIELHKLESPTNGILHGF